MINSSKFSHFTLSAYFDRGLLDYFCFVIVLLLYVLTVCANVLLIVVICMNRCLHEPMYIFLCSLFVNELLGSSGLFPFIMLQILSDVHSVSAPLCFLQVFCVYTYANVEFWTLAVMSYDRYLAICCPLQYNTHMTQNKMAGLLVLTWLYPFLAVVVLISLSSTLQLCGNVIDKVYCDNFSIVKLACSDTSVNNIYGIVLTVLTICVVILIVYTYVKIIQVCFSGSRLTRHKAVSTCMPHLTSLMNFSVGAFFEIIQNRFNMEHMPRVLRILLSLYWLTCQPLFNPVLYGLNLTKIRIMCKKSLIVAQM